MNTFQPFVYQCAVQVRSGKSGQSQSLDRYIFTKVKVITMIQYSWPQFTRCTVSSFANQLNNLDSYSIQKFSKVVQTYLHIETKTIAVKSIRCTKLSNFIFFQFYLDEFQQIVYFICFYLHFRPGLTEFFIAINTNKSINISININKSNYFFKQLNKIRYCMSPSIFKETLLEGAKLQL
ncbi:Hypothetical_protein [Hexamita inflata]|uniref:Hypothetical_protein n=1 Tax=Hexamita inflata TaxID=28002 RepID=A0AA86PKL3_9EUKA|nr:Hypothetical protein HINF_LOCUS24847 [Hexamita inflata]